MIILVILTIVDYKINARKPDNIFNRNRLVFRQLLASFTEPELPTLHVYSFDLERFYQLSFITEMIMSILGV